VNVNYHYTHYRVAARVALVVDGLALAAGCSWNTYYDHPPGWGLDATSVDFWHAKGRGVALPLKANALLVGRILRAHKTNPVRWLISKKSIWTPQDGWTPYSGYQHYGRLRHVHVTYR